MSDSREWVGVGERGRNCEIVERCWRLWQFYEKKVKIHYINYNKKKPQHKYIFAFFYFRDFFENLRNFAMVKQLFNPGFENTPSKTKFEFKFLLEISYSIVLSRKNFYITKLCMNLLKNKFHLRESQEDTKLNLQKKNQAKLY